MSSILIPTLLLAACTHTTKTSTIDLGGKSTVSKTHHITGLRPYQEVTLSNGLRAILIPDDSLPYIAIQMTILGGSALDPDSKSGLTQFVASLLSKGTLKHSAIQIADLMGDMASEFSTEVGQDSIVLGASTLSAYEDQILELFGEIVTQPAFSEKEIARLKAQFIGRIDRKVDDPGDFANDIMEEYLYGNHPYAHDSMGTAMDLKSIQKKHIFQHYLKYFRPNRSLIVVSGKFGPDLVTKLENTFKSWEARPVEPIVFPKVAPIKGRQFLVVDRPHASQAQVRFATFGISRNDPDYLALRIANQILGEGSFASRLMAQVRVAKGLTYSISSAFDTNVDTGSFEISTFTKSSQVGTLLRETFEVLQNFQARGVTEEEVKVAKAGLLGNFPRAVETAERLGANLSTLRVYGVSDDYLANFMSNIQGVSVKEVNAAIARHFNFENMKILVVGDSKSILEQVRPFGLVETRKLSDFSR